MHQINIQLATENKTSIPPTSSIKKWAKKALTLDDKQHEVTIRIVDPEEMSELNQTYRKKKGPTNVLSFPLHLPADIKSEIPLLGDVIICAMVVDQEAKEQNKAKDAHWAHIIMHGILHLLGYDHQKEKDAQIMESIEIKLLASLKYPNPYEHGEGAPDHE